MAERRRPYLALRHGDYRKLWASQLVSLTGSQMQVVAINWHVYVLTRSPLALGFVGFTRFLPIVLFSLWGGIVADRNDRRKVMIATQVSMTVVAVALAALTFTRNETVWLLYALNALSAAASAFDGPARQALIPRLVSADDLPGALSLNLTVFHTAMIAGPSLAGILIAGGTYALGLGPDHATTLAHGTSGMAWIYALNAVSFLAVLAALASIRKESGIPRRVREKERMRNALAVGLRFVFSTPLLVWTMGLDFFATFFAGAMSLLPIFADQILHAGPVGYGVLVAAPGIGALLGALHTSVSPLAPKQGRTFLWAVTIYGAATVVFGLSRSFALTFFALALSGLADLISTVIRQTLRQLITPDELRGRMTSIHMIFFMGGPQLGELEAGVVAALFASVTLGATVAVVSGGLATMAVAGIVAAASPAVRRYDLDESVRATDARAPAG
jgi:MFS family permease